MWNDEDTMMSMKKNNQNLGCIERVDDKILYYFYTLKVAKKKRKNIVHVSCQINSLRCRKFCRIHYIPF